MTLLLGWAASVLLKRNVPAEMLRSDIPWISWFTGHKLEPGVTPSDGQTRSRRIAELGRDTRSKVRAGSMNDPSSSRETHHLVSLLPPLQLSLVADEAEHPQRRGQSEG